MARRRVSDAPAATCESELALLLAATRAAREARTTRIARLACRVDWRRLHRLLAAERMLALLGTRLLEAAPGAAPDWLAAEVAATVERERTRMELLEAIQVGLCARLEASGVPALPLKGPLLARRLHGDPGLRPCSDVDVLVPPEQLDAAVATARAMGYEAPVDPAVVGDLPLLHRALPGSSSWLPPVELHWRVHWYERSFSARMLSASEPVDGGPRAPRPEDDLAALLLFLARDGFQGLRLLADTAAWWDRHGAGLAAAPLDDAIARHPALCDPLLAAAGVAERMAHVPPARLASAHHRGSRRARLAARLAAPSEPDDARDRAAVLTLADMLLTPRGEGRDFVRRALLPPLSAIRLTYGAAARGWRGHVRRLLHGRAVAAQYLPRWLGLAWRARRGAGCGDRPRVMLAVHSAARGGAERMALMEATRLAERVRLDVSIPAGPLRERFREHGEIVAAAPLLPLWGASPARWALQLARTPVSAVAMSWGLRRRRTELVLTNSAVSLAPVLAARLAGVPAIVHARDVTSSRLAPAVFWLHALLADTVVAISPELAARFPTRLRARVVTIRDGVPIAAASNGARPALGSTPVRLCVTGAIDPRKGQDLAVETLAALRTGGVDATLDVIGRVQDADFAGRVRERALALDVADRVAFRGELDRLEPALRDVDVVLVPSRAEWTPLAAMEALASARPVVAADVGAVGDVVVHGQTGLLTPAGDSGAMADAVAELAAAPETARALARRGRAHVAARFDLERTLTALEDEIDRLLATHGGAP